MASDHRDQLITPESKALAWAPARSPTGEVFPYGYGWFTAEHAGRKIVWHGGAWRGMSCMYLKVPEESLTFIFLFNSKVQSDAFDMARGDSLKSGFDLAFLRLFVYEPLFSEIGPDIDWLAPTETILEQIEGVRDERLRDLYMREIRVMSGMYMFISCPCASPRSSRSRMRLPLRSHRCHRYEHQFPDPA